MPAAEPAVLQVAGDLLPLMNGLAESVVNLAGPRLSGQGGFVHLELVAIVVDGYDAAIDFFVDALGFDLVEDLASSTDAGTSRGGWLSGRPEQ